MAPAHVLREQAGGTSIMYSKPMILPLDLEGKIYSLQDENGNTIGTGTREVCEVLMYIITKPLARANVSPAAASVTRRPNVRAAIAI
jgi:hypothetical protein